MPSSSHQILNFFHDEEDSCALTILATQTRFHIIADVDNLRDNTGSSADNSNIWQTYSQLLAQYKRSIEGEDCGSRDESIDSGVDMGSSLTNGGQSKFVEGDDAEEALHDWLISPLRSKISKMADESQDRKRTLFEWYTFPTSFYNLKAHKGKLQAEELESTPDLESRMSNLRPDLGPVPKYIRNIDVPWFSSHDLKVINCSNSPPPYHPATVEVPPSSSDNENKSLFFKSVDNANIQPTKREISLLHQLEKKGLYDKIRCPRLEGIVTREGDKTSIMGFLQTLIPGPIPLTEKFESCIAQEKRERWAQEAEQIKDTLHEHGIIWGDAKGDNFVVDSSDELWIIDFGGSYTEGWIDPEIAETKRGDNMGVEKVVNALRDPDRNVAHGSEDDHGEENNDEGSKGKKRKAADNEQPRESKRQRAGPKKERLAEIDGSTEQRYCYCGGVSSGQMIGCDGSDCQMEWFHLECTGLVDLPGEDEAWFCRKCEWS
ncbi:hypothetical protein N0V93_005775 [Gnomoniopsis smithogilvyi]|uniref:PHD-type domain-containing protein n=1 Tax=Gnomoniopsis smithogilvyi TaxID=1191159 RepID=A0A9W8YTF5_9PEZI|nr:hypothetical protein N0V93_005775 [Gnomoniopsis smithogilvyi]